MIPLSLLSSGSSAEVVEIIGEADQIRRVRELGFSRGAQLEVVRSGSPCIIRMAGQTLCFRGSDLLSILVQPTAAST